MKMSIMVISRQQFTSLTQFVDYDFSPPGRNSFRRGMLSFSNDSPRLLSPAQGEIFIISITGGLVKLPNSQSEN
jgi:hypothetical protein